MIKHKKYISALVVLSLSCSLLTGCSSGKTNKDIAPVKNTKIEGLGIDYLPKKLTQEDLDAKYEEFKEIVEKLIKESNLEINNTDDDYYGYSYNMVTSDLIIEDIYVYRKENYSAMHISENIDLENKYDIKGTIFDKALKEIIKDDIDYDKLNSYINYKIENKSMWSDGLSRLDIPPIIVNDVIINFSGVDECLTMHIKASNGNPDSGRGEYVSNNIKYSYNDNNKGLIELDNEDKELITKLIIPKYEALIKKYYGDDVYIAKEENKSISFDYRDEDDKNKFDISISNINNDLVSLSMLYDYKVDKQFDIRDNSMVIEALEILFDNLDYDDINDALNHMMTVNKEKGYEDSDCNYLIHFPQGVSLEIDLRYNSDEVEIAVAFGEYDI